MARQSLLPDNRAAFEEAADLTGARIGALPVDLSPLVRPYEVPSAHLPWLAWGLGVDLWDKDWDEEKKRVRMARALPFHAIKGTRTAIAEALAVVDVEALRFVVPPAKTYLSRSLAAAEREAFLNRFAQLRVYPFVSRGITGAFGCFLSMRRGLGASSLGPVNSVSLQGTRYMRTAKLVDGDAETDLTIRVVTPETMGRFEATEYDEVVLAPKPTRAVHLNAKPAAAAYLVDDIGLRRRIVRIPRAAGYSYRLGREQYTTVLPDGDLIEVRPQYIAEVHPAQSASVFPGASGARIEGACLPPTISWRYLYERWHIHDPDRAFAERSSTTHLGVTRLGMPPYTAEALTRIRRRRAPRSAGPFINGYLHATSKKPIADARAAVRVAKSLRDKVLINTKTYRLPRAGDRFEIGSLQIGAFIEV
jgi:hypothetical protein